MKFIFLLLTVVVLWGCSESEAERRERIAADSARKADSVAALLRPRREPYEAAVAMVKERLKAPAGAYFAPVLLKDDTVQVRLVGDSLATIVGEYDSQNAFGTYLHGYYKATLRKVGEKWIGAERYDFQSVQLTDYKPF